MTSVRNLLFAASCLAAPLFASGSDQAALDRGLETIQAEMLRSDLEFIASDELAGRDTPSQGQRLAARYLRARLKRLGFEPAGGSGDFLHHFELERVTMDLESSSLTFVLEGADAEFELFEDYAFFSSAALTQEGELVFVGKCSSEELEGLDLSGAWAVAYASEEVPFRGREAGARAAGAVGLVTLPEPGDEGESRTMRYARRSLRRSGMRTPSAEAPFASVHLSASGAEKLFTGEAPAVGARLPGRLRESRVIKEREVIPLENVAGLWPGSDPELAKEVLIVSAHYDHVGVGSNGDIYNGADDNGSGTCGLLGLADALVAYGPMRRSILLLWVSGEEKGLLGSAAWTKAPTLPEGTHAVLNLNIDMIGRNAPDYLLITPTADHEAYNFLTRMAELNAPLEGFPKLGSADQYWRRSDHVNFSVNMGIPVAFLFSDVHEDYHKPTDTIEKIDFDKMRRITRLVLRMLDGLQGTQLDP